ncbi:hypothetical protein ERX46_02090 [Brumimicrobium glaciale]|uniref:Uncharacterized protein n=1 Tax=Brumimicrobium glaciale TaxID=200475 RepID=A0A4Q4KQX5_9FLAO|nr:hypothetical protein [Brumimicrobium glaciale]RYM35807.1 hypothetical protein ERX46_02090 [Brumimicrobium glaciale]
MKQSLKYLSITNIIGFSIVSLALIIHYLVKPFVWGDWLIVINLLTSTPFIIAGVMTLKMIKNPNERHIQNMLVIVFLIIWLPSLGLPLAFEYGGLLICLSILLVGLLGLLKVKEPMNKLIFINLVSTLFLLLNTLIVVGVIIEK